MMMYIITREESYGNDVRGFLDSWKPGHNVHYTPGGLAWRDAWGPNRYAGNFITRPVIQIFIHALWN